MQCKELFEKIDSLNEKYIKVWEEFCNIESPTADKEAVDEAGRYLVRLAEERGWKVEVSRQEVAGDAYCFTLNPEVDAAPISFSGHIDTVHPKGLFGYPPVHMDEQFIYGPGVTDCKGGVIASMMAMEALQLCGFKGRPVQLIVQSDEETGSKTSGKKTVEFMCEKAKGSIAFLNTESMTEGKATMIRKGILRYRFDIHGIAAHSAKCYNGSNAIEEAAHKILKLEHLKDKDGLTCNCGVISGGTVANTVAAECSLTVDIRHATGQQGEEAIALLTELAENNTVIGCTCDLVKVSDRPAMELVDRNVQLLNAMNKIYEANGMIPLEIDSANGGSDAAYTTVAGIPTVDKLGVQGEAIHSVREHALLDSLAKSAKRLASVAYCI